jgi:cytochrome P450
MVAPPIDLPGMPLRRGRAARDWIDAQSRQFIRDARARAARTGLINDMVSAFDCSDGALSDDVLVANIRLLLLAGHETSASTIAWMVIELAQHPELWDALVEEAQRVGAVPTGHEDLAQCPVAEALFRETLRMHPASSLVPRRAMQELQLGQRRIPSGTHLCIPLLHFSTSPLLHEAPDQFRLGRWLQRTEPIRPVDMLQFGAGPHVCMGYHLVWLELVQFSIALALTMQEAGVRPRLMSGVEKGRRYYPTAHPSMTVRIGFS